MKLPSFQFYPGDWMKDPNLRRCSLAARGLWMDLLCLMFESETRGKLVTNGVTWALQEIAEALQGDQKRNLELIQELINKGVAKRDENGAIFSKRLMDDEIKRTKTRERVGNWRASNTHCNADVTHHVTPVYEDEDEDSSKEGFIGEEAFNRSVDLYPKDRQEHGQATQVLYFDAIRQIRAERKIGSSAASEWLDQRIRKYSKDTKFPVSFSKFLREKIWKNVQADKREKSLTERMKEQGILD